MTAFDLFGHFLTHVLIYLDLFAGTVITLHSSILLSLRNFMCVATPMQQPLCGAILISNSMIKKNKLTGAFLSWIIQWFIPLPWFRHPQLENNQRRLARDKQKATYITHGGSMLPPQTHVPEWDRAFSQLQNSIIGQINNEFILIGPLVVKKGKLGYVGGFQR